MPTKQHSTFGELLQEELAKAKPIQPPVGYCLASSGGRYCQLCRGSRFDYASEAAAKGRALQRWSRQERDFPEAQWIPSPQGRHYRCVSKRRWLSRDKQLIMPEEVEHGRVRGQAISACLLEAPGHAAIYRDLQAWLPTSRFSDLVNYTILKGDLERFHLVLNLTDIRQQRAEVNRLSKKITAAHPSILSVWLVEGKPDDDHYLNPLPGCWERLYGPRTVQGPNKLHYSPLCFTQVNPTVVPALIQTVRDWLDRPELPLLDLYCGYGLFSLSLGRTGAILGLELSRESVESARDNARHGKIRAHFAHSNLDEADLPMATAKVPLSKGFQAVVDPPRGGAPSELITQLADLGPHRVAHLVCDVEKCFEQAALWWEHGYRVERLVALDMFPGTPGLEVVLCLEGRH